MTLKEKENKVSSLGEMRWQDSIIRHLKNELDFFVVLILFNI